MTTDQTRNAKIASTMLGAEDHGILTAFLYLEWESAAQGFGGYALDVYDPIAKCRIGHAFGSTFIRGVLDTLEVGSWEKLPGTHCRMQWTIGRVHAIGHIIKDKWFYPQTTLEQNP